MNGNVSTDVRPKPDASDGDGKWFRGDDLAGRIRSTNASAIVGSNWCRRSARPPPPRRRTRAHRSTAATRSSRRRQSATARIRPSSGISSPAGASGSRRRPSARGGRARTAARRERADAGDQPGALDRMGATWASSSSSRRPGLPSTSGRTSPCRHRAAPRRAVDRRSPRPSSRAGARPARRARPTRAACPPSDGSQTLIAAVKIESLVTVGEVPLAARNPFP